MARATKKAEVVDEWEDKAYLKYLPPHLQDRYRDSLSDPALTHLIKQIALMDVRIKMLLEMIDQQVLGKEEIADDLRLEFEHLDDRDALDLAGFIMGYLPTGFINPRTFKRLENLVDRFERAEDNGKTRDVEAAKKQLFQMIREGKRDGEVWDDVKATMEERRKLSEAEERRLNQQQHTLPLDRVVMLCGILIESFKGSVLKYVPEREIQQYILEDADLAYRKQLGMGADRPTNQFPMD